jgi:hypothetical protein
MNSEAIHDTRVSSSNPAWMTAAMLGCDTSRPQLPRAVDRPAAALPDQVAHRESTDRSSREQARIATHAGARAHGDQRVLASDAAAGVLHRVGREQGGKPRCERWTRSSELCEIALALLALERHRAHEGLVERLDAGWRLVPCAAEPLRHRRAPWRWR